MNSPISQSIKFTSRLTASQDSYIHPGVRYGKRGFDLVFSVCALFVLAPVFVLLAIAIKLDSQGPVFYKQIRLGKSPKGQNKFFEIIKFRSMGTDAEIAGKALLASKGDPRITRVGRFLRKTRLDEVPQFFNIIRGEMSLIGPRPERPELTTEIEKKMPFFTERTYQVLPGITGLAQTNQSYLDSVNDIDQKLAFDHAYSLAISSPVSWLKTDIAILVQTVITVVKCNG
ncbi:sugar transferase [Psychromonas sp. Urea-02u-13]|uniref:sugar transferase n=1 Tax=Psychromonas sp. Urea-02u-13 TaxID=2058326 RepID=UPI000C31E8D8|nr:sugar transferase [Psychromonas sp. Urea-02u-13]PKG37914.1 sugar transferase [Psychromonas sp. Urea-02u-13]